MRGLAYQRAQFAPLMVAQDGLRSNITRALAEEATYPGITDLMSQLAKTGFAPVDELMDPRAERLSLLGIAGCVAYEHRVIGLPADAWLRPPLPGAHPYEADDPYEAGLVPTSQMSRLLILLKLKRLSAEAHSGNASPST